uniref:Small integral membrane protein 4 n=2 Tax=Lepeophtheirus salmonis TaxID=72036 RepID=A0A0K2TED0_LEPSM
MRKRKPLLRRLIEGIPGEKIFGVWRFLPLFFIAGAGLEYTMIHWTFRTTNFYKTYKKRQVLNALEEEGLLEEYKKYGGH